MDSELKLYQQIQTKLAKHPREVQMRTLAWVSNKLREEYEAKPGIGDAPTPDVG
jgi:hypothetical protein